jgi:SAM-dependent methyltransferase
MFSAASRRRFKYTLAADAIDVIVRFTPFLDGGTRPPEAINFAGHKSFDEVGDLTVSLMREHAGLDEGDRVLDIGCAIARNALALHRAFGSDISYAGFDIVPYGISWSRKRFAQLPGRYDFAHADVWNSFYNPRGRARAEDFEFPYDDNAFDVSVATSVYTHMRRKAVAQYLSETARVTRSGGRAYFTLFSHEGVGPDSRFSFANAGEGDWFEDAAEPEMAVAQDLDWMRAHLRELGATKIDLYPGYWRGGEGLDFQDILVAQFGNSF